MAGVMGSVTNWLLQSDERDEHFVPEPKMWSYFLLQGHTKRSWVIPNGFGHTNEGIENNILPLSSILYLAQRFGPELRNAVDHRFEMQRRLAALVVGEFEHRFAVVGVVLDRDAADGC